MSFTSGFIAAGCAAVFVFSAVAQDTQQHTARELFYLNSRELTYQAGTAGQAKPETPPAPAKTAQAAPVTARRPPARPATTTAQTKPPVSTPPRTERTDSTASLPDGGKVMQASLATAPAPANGPALGLRLTILKRTDNGMTEVPTNSVFHARDAIQLTVQTNYPGYLYIVNQGSSGAWKPMFPAPEFDGGNNHVDGYNTYTFPPRRMVFDEHKGTEKVFVIFSRERATDFESLIYSLQGGQNKPQPKPAATTPEPARPNPPVVMASVSDSEIGRFRNTYSRDLIIEPVTPETPGDRKETATYVVNPTGSDDSRVVADLHLEHQ
jgi:hypothetical protein